MKATIYLQKTRLDWMVAGGTSVQNTTKTTCYLTTLESQLSKFWTVEELAIDKPKSNETESKIHFFNTVHRENNERYVVCLPFREASQHLGESRTIALKCLASLELNAKATLRTEYIRVMEEYLKLGHMSVVETPNDDGFYMPHHAIIKESSNITKLRVVFDASAETNKDISLNDVLMIGPMIQDELFSHLIRFWTYKFVINANRNVSPGAVA